MKGLDIYYEIHGSGAPLVLLHDPMGTIDTCFASLLTGRAENGSARFGEQLMQVLERRESIAAA